ncbi:DNA-deoxyinosine glycosylase [Sulfuriferula plumbiphila]|nr:DNA-deoxyinosine glycosylase [Sulfuriferula plumbiphila]
MQLSSRAAMPYVHSFPPIADAQARVLILGSMPGKISLQAQQYYAHPRNAFWRLLGELVGARAELPYATRLQMLKSSGIALWDVLQSCAREGSLDSGIDDASIIANDFASFHLAHPDIAHIFFNGAKAEACYRKYVLAGLSNQSGALQYQRLPSTSPAHASLSYAQKLKAWEIVKLKAQGL